MKTTDINVFLIEIKFKHEVNYKTLVKMLILTKFT